MVVDGDRIWLTTLGRPAACRRWWVHAAVRFRLWETSCGWPPGCPIRKAVRLLSLNHSFAAVSYLKPYKHPTVTGWGSL